MTLSFINTWQFNLLGFILFSVIFNQFYKLAVKTVKNDGAATIIFQTIAGLSILFLTPFLPITFPNNWKLYALLIIACLFYAINDRLQTTVRKNIDVSIYTVINQLSSVFLILYGLFIFKEPFYFLKIIGASLIILANIILQYSGGKFMFNKYVLLAALANLSLATALSIDIGISSKFNLPIYIMLTLIIPMILIKNFEKIKILKIKEEFLRINKFFSFITGVSWGLLIFFMIRAYQLGSFTLITPLSSTSVLINVLIATIFLDEKKDILKKILAAVLVIVGVYLTVI